MQPDGVTHFYCTDEDLRQAVRLGGARARLGFVPVHGWIARRPALCAYGKARASSVERCPCGPLRAAHESPPPYTLIALTKSDIPEAEKRRIAVAFLDEPHHCLSLFCRRLRARCPDVRSLMDTGAKLVHAWAAGSFVGIDIAERTHAKMRQSLKGDHRAKAFAPVANQNMCAELREIHMARGGRDPALLDATPPAQAGLEGASPDAQAEVQGASPHGLNPYLLFRNQRFHARKQAPGPPLNKEEMHALDARCKLEWADMTEDDRRPWRRVFRGYRVARSLPPVQDAGGVEEGERPTYRCWCGTSTQAQPIPLPALGDRLAQSKAGTRARSSQDSWIGSATRRASLLPKGAEVQRLMWGCYGGKKASREVPPQQQAMRVDDITSLLRTYADSLGADVVGKAETLFCLRGVSPEPEAARLDLTMLLVMDRRSPHIQFLAVCDRDDCDDPFALLPNEFPFIVCLRLTPSKLTPGTSSSVDIVTSEEIAKRLSREQMVWALHPLQWEVPREHPLLEHRVTGIGEAWVPRPTKRGSKRTRPNDDDIEIPDDDPLDAGRREGVARSRLGKIKRSHQGDAPKETEEQEYGGEHVAESQLFEDLDPDERLSLAVDLFGSDVENELFGMGGAPDGEGGEGTDDEASTSDCSEEFADDEPAPLGPSMPLPMVVTPEVALDHCEVWENGYVSCNVFPWNTKSAIGRITRWPKKTLKNIQCSCYQHTRCKTRALMVNVASEKQLVLWLLRGTWEPTANRKRRRQLGDEHKDMLDDALRDGPVGDCSRPVLASSSAL